jgi:YD repeat-containing protein
MLRFIKPCIYILAISFSVIVFNSCEKSETDDIVDDITDFKDGDCTLKKTVNKSGNVTYEYDNDGKLTMKTFNDTAGGPPMITEYFYTGSLLDSVKSGSTIWTMEYFGLDSMIVRKFVGITLRERYVYYHTSGGPTSVAIYDYDKLVPHTWINFEFKDNNMNRMTILKDNNLDGETDDISSIEYQYHDQGKNGDRYNPDRWLNPYGGADDSENVAIKATFKDGSGNVVNEVDYNYRFNEYGFPTSLTVHGKTTTFDWDCVE